MDNKPITITIKETKEAIVAAINNSNLHPFILDSIMKDIYNEIHILYMNQIAQDEKEYMNAQEQKEPAQ